MTNLALDVLTRSQPIGLTRCLAASVIGMSGFGAHAQTAAPNISAGLSPDINVENWYWSPGNHWSYKNARRVFPSADVFAAPAPLSGDRNQR